MGSTDTCGIEHSEDIIGHIGDAKRSGRQVAAPASPVVHQHEPEMLLQLPYDRFPPEAIETHPLDQHQPWPPPMRHSTELVGDPQLTAAGIPRPHIASSLRPALPAFAADLPFIGPANRSPGQ